jgi:hypothetical protein
LKLGVNVVILSVVAKYSAKILAFVKLQLFRQKNFPLINFQEKTPFFAENWSKSQK